MKRIRVEGWGVIYSDGRLLRGVWQTKNEAAQHMEVGEQVARMEIEVEIPNRRPWAKETDPDAGPTPSR